MLANLFTRKALALALAACGLAACTPARTPFVGHWVNKSRPAEALEIRRDGDVFVIVQETKGQEAVKVAATYKDGTLTVASPPVTFSYLASSDTLLASSLFSTGQEYKRVP